MSHTFTFPSRPKKNKDELNTFKISIQHIVVELRWTDIWKNNIEKGWKKSRKRKIILQTAIWTDGHVHNKNNTSREKLILASVFSTSPIYTIHYLNKKNKFYTIITRHKLIKSLTIIILFDGTVVLASICAKGTYLEREGLLYRTILCFCHKQIMVQWMVYQWNNYLLTTHQKLKYLIT